MDGTQDRWKKIEDFDFSNPDDKSISIDTRDFHAIGQKEIYHPIDLTKIDKLSERFYYTPEELKEMLIELKKRSGGDAKWRYLNFEGYGEWVKYLRIHRYEKGLLICDNGKENTRAFNKEFFKGNINKEYLSAH